MMTQVIMLLLAMLLAAMLLLRDEEGQNAAFFDRATSQAMRGFWCIIIVLVHIPQAHQNRLQDMLGSFAYIGVTFFFLTSAYGLCLEAERNDNFARSFWSKRLSRLLLPMLLNNVLYTIVCSVLRGEFSLMSLVRVNGWVRQLLVFYGIFWIIFGLLSQKIPHKQKAHILYASIFAVSLIAYIGKDTIFLGWPTESFGFLYGVLLYKFKDQFVAFASKHWNRKCILAFLFSLLAGVLYIRLKKYVFFGDYFLKILLGILLLGLLLIWNAKMPMGNRVSRFVGKISYEVYLVHSTVFLLLDALPLNISSGIFVLVSILGTIALSYVMNSISSFVFKLLGEMKEWGRS